MHNAYTYAGDGPTNGVDPGGLSFWSGFAHLVSVATCVATSFIPSVGGGDLAALGFGAVGLGGAVGAYTLSAGGAIAATGIGTGLIIGAVGVGMLAVLIKAFGAPQLLTLIVSGFIA